VAAQVVLTIFVVDLLFFLKHWMSHRVGTLWHFHTIHHSQRELNVLTDRRQHVFEHLVAQVFVFLPAIILGLKPYSVMSISAALWFHTFLIHGNIRTNFGWLGQVFISPQYHRIHHSIEPRHRDKNFGTIITLWDRIFGTRYPGTDEYPGTGVEGVEFPPPQSLKPQAWLADIGRQLWYPFRKVLKLP
jgi:sterol desaturase/sphingolipid hydroxylase (fatty acid hydroxylase superfamily)